LSFGEALKNFVDQSVYRRASVPPEGSHPRVELGATHKDLAAHLERRQWTVRVIKQIPKAPNAET
jgi:hypothetical protein